MAPYYRKPAFLIGLFNTALIATSTYHLRSHLIYNLEEQEARLDEIEGTLRGHIGLIYDGLDRIENGGPKKTEGGTKAKELYESRARDEGKKGGK